jgi:[acyl-carrier-protein] S-malonyltransferase
MTKTTSLLFPGQGSQVVGMGKTFYQQFPEARLVFEHANDILQTSLSSVIFEGPLEDLTKTRIAQPALFVTSLAILAVLQSKFHLSPICAAGLSLGEYTALVATKTLSFEEALPLVAARASFMHDACEQFPGKMLAILGLSDDEVIELVRSLNKPTELYCANFNCPGQVVVSGTPSAIDIAANAAKERGVRSVMLQTSGAFHSGLMKKAQDQLEPLLRKTTFIAPSFHLAMNTTGTFVETTAAIQENLINQVTSSVLWHKCVASCAASSPSLFLEIGPGKSLCNMNKRMGMTIPSVSVETVDDLAIVEKHLSS